MLFRSNVVVSFSNGDPPLTLRSDLITGTYSGTWNVGNAQSQVTMSAIGSYASFPSASTQISGTVNANTSPAPVLANDGILHNSDPKVGGALAPGNVAQVYGSGLASKTVSPGVVPLATQFNGTEVIIGGLSAPLYFLKSEEHTSELQSH